MELDKSKEVAKETIVHGDRWNRIHGGYFASKENAEVLLKMIKDASERYSPDIIIDLGAGTGIILHWLSEILDSPRPGLVAMDISERQLNVIREKYSGEIIPVQDSFTNFRRDNIPGLAGGTGIFISRSTFHYVGEEFFSVLIKHIRTQMKTGEHLIHQTASFADSRNAELLNNLYAMMQSSKWYPSLDFMTRIFEKNSFKVENVLTAPALPLDSQDLKVRYALTDRQIHDIISMVSDCYPDAEMNVFRAGPDSFTAFLHYFCMHCVAI